MNRLPVAEERQHDDLCHPDRSAKATSLGQFSAAVIGAYIAFLPLLQILLPLKAARIAPTGAVAAVYVVAAGVANFVVGWLSDRTR